jgi:hypothetical protein
MRTVNDQAISITVAKSNRKSRHGSASDPKKGNAAKGGNKENRGSHKARTNNARQSAETGKKGERKSRNLFSQVYATPSTAKRANGRTTAAVEYVDGSIKI